MYSKIKAKRVGRAWKAAFSNASQAVVSVVREESGNLRVYLTPAQEVTPVQVYTAQQCDVMFGCGDIPGEMCVVIESDTGVKEVCVTSDDTEAKDLSGQFWPQ